MMRILNDSEISTVSGGMPKGVELAVLIAAGAAADAFGGPVGGAVYWSMENSLEFNSSNVWAQQAVSDAYLTGADD